MEGEKKKLVVHWDINGTITAFDTTEKGNARENANMVVSKSVFGKVNNDGKWILNEDINDMSDSISYYDHLKSVDKSNYKKRSFTFTEPNNPGESLSHLVEKILSSSDVFLFSSFLKAVEKFPQALHVVRTFGQDTRDVVLALRKHETLKSKFEHVSFGKPISIDTIEVNGSLMSFKEFNTLLSQTDNHIFIQENYEYWDQNNRKKDFGKQLVAHPDLIQVFFDDNDCVSIQEASKDTHFVLVNTLSALMDDDYYVDLINSVLSSK